MWQVLRQACNAAMWPKRLPELLGHQSAKDFIRHICRGHSSCRSPVGIAYWLSTAGQLSSKVSPCSLARFGHVIRLPVASYAWNCEKGLLIFLSQSSGGSPIGIRFRELKLGVGVLIIESFAKVAWQSLGKEVL